MCRGGRAAKAHHGSRARSDRYARSNTSLIRFVRSVRSPSPIGLTSLSSLSTLIRSCTRIAVCRCAPCCRGSVCCPAAPAHGYLYSYICISVYICICLIFSDLHLYILHIYHTFHDMYHMFFGSPIGLIFFCVMTTRFAPPIPIRFSRSRGARTAVQYYSGFFAPPAVPNVLYINTLCYFCGLHL